MTRDDVPRPPAVAAGAGRGRFVGLRSGRKTRKATSAAGGALESGGEIAGWRAEAFLPYQRQGRQPGEVVGVEVAPIQAARGDHQQREEVDRRVGDLQVLSDQGDRRSPRRGTPG